MKLSIDERDKEQKKIVNVNKEIEILRNWLTKQAHLPQDLNDDFLTFYILGTKSIEIAKTKIDAYFTLRTKMPEMFSRRDPTGPDFSEAAEGVKIFFLPKLTPEGFLVMVSREGNPDKFDHAHKTRRMAMMIELAMLLWPTQVNLMVVYDLRFFQPSLLSKLSPKHASQGLQWFQGSVPMKLKKVVAFNAPSFVTVIINTFFKSCLKKKLFDRIHVYSSNETCLKEHIPLELLPEDYGGQQASSNELNNYWLEQLRSHKDWFLREESKIVDESRRAKDTQHSGNMFGLDGTFKSLNID